MKSHVRVAVIGGGVVGCSVLYHLTKKGWSDVVLIERSELTSGSTWHAAGGMHTLNSDPTVAKLQEYTINLYRELEEISGQSCSVHMPGGMMLADTPERLDFLKTARAKGKVLGMETEFISMAEAAERHPLMDPSHFVGALFDPNEGHVDPSGVTQAYAKAARIQGAEVYRFNPVVDVKQRPDGNWDVVTEKGTIVAENVVNAGGLWAREVGRMVGLELPVLAMEHQYLVTDDMPEIMAASAELPHCIDFGGEAYLRQEGQGMLLGTYEKAGVPWSPHTTPWDFGHELLQQDLDRIAPSLETAFTHFPGLANAGIKTVVNGPFTFAPDGNPLVGPVEGLRGFYLACGVMAGFSQGGGVGLALADWIVEGDPGMDVFAMDASRFGDWATRGYTHVKVRENYSRRFSITYPNEELPAGRPLRTTPLYGRLSDRGAVWGASYGLEHALWFAPEGQEPKETPTYLHSNAFGPTAEECRGVRESVGVLEIANYAKYEVSGPDAAAWLDGMVANTLPRVGRLTLAPLLSDRGTLMGDFTVGRLGENRFLLVGSGTAEGFHMRWFRQHLPERGVTVRALAPALGGLSLAGPRSRDLLARLTDEDVSAEAFKFFDIRRLEIARCPATVARVTFTGELGFEIYLDAPYQATVYDAVVAAGADLGLVHFGGRALNSLRLEKSFGSWTREYTPDQTPWEAGLGRFVKLDKGPFIGRDAARAASGTPPARALVLLAVDHAGADATGDEPVLRGDDVVGYVTSAGYGHTVGRSLALAYVDRAVAGEVDGFTVEILGDPRPATRLAQPPVDPSGSRMRS
ncbi:MAG: GcvT family protein [Rhodobacterales bacterium]|nr:GcvT family protein [Rhodobacterales bacterium]